MTHHNTTITLVSPTDIEYTLDVDYELAADTLEGWTITSMKVHDPSDGLRIEYSPSEIESEAYILPGHIRSHFRKEIEALILEASNSDPSVPRLKPEGYWVR